MAMELVKDFLSKKWAKWVIMGVAVIILFIIFPQLFFAVLVIVLSAIPLAIVYIYYRKNKPKPQKPANDIEFNQYCGALNANEMRNLVISGGN